MVQDGFLTALGFPRAWGHLIYLSHLVPALTQHHPALPRTAPLLGLAVPVPPPMATRSPPLASAGAAPQCLAPVARGHLILAFLCPPTAVCLLSPIFTVCSHRVLAFPLV